MNNDTLHNQIHNLTPQNQPVAVDATMFGGIALIGIGLALIGILFYIFLWNKKKHDLPDKTFFRAISYLIAYTPKTSALLHIIPGLLITIGIGIFVGYGLGYCTSEKVFSINSSAITISSLVFATLTAAITFWTLNQTKKLEHQQGYSITDFQSLIRELNAEIEWLDKNFKKIHKRKAQYFHRLYFITNNPFLGMLSFPDEDFTTDFINNLRKLKDIVKDSNGNSEFKFEIICGNEYCINLFHQDFYSLANAADSYIKTANEQFKSYISEFEISGDHILTRVSDVPEYPQFVIIGNKIFDFTLKAKTPYSQISETKVTIDSERCELYIKTFELLKSSLPKKP